MLKTKNDIIEIAKTLTKEEFLNNAQSQHNMGKLNGYYECPFGYDLYCANLCDMVADENINENLCKKCWEISMEEESIKFKD